MISLHLIVFGFKKKKKKHFKEPFELANGGQVENPVACGSLRTLRY